MDAPLAARQCLPMVELTCWDEEEPEYGKKHLRSMVEQMQTWDQTVPKERDKTMRWLGWLQAAIVIGDGASLEEMKQINKAA